MREPYTISPQRMNTKIIPEVSLHNMPHPPQTQTNIPIKASTTFSPTIGELALASLRRLRRRYSTSTQRYTAMNPKNIPRASEPFDTFDITSAVVGCTAKTLVGNNTKRTVLDRRSARERGGGRVDARRRRRM